MKQWKPLISWIAIIIGWAIADAISSKPTPINTLLIATGFIAVLYNMGQEK